MLTRLSEAVTIGHIDFGGDGKLLPAHSTDGLESGLESGRDEMLGDSVTSVVGVSCGGILNCIALWYELHLPGGGTIDLGPSDPPPKHPTLSGLTSVAA